MGSAGSGRVFDLAIIGGGINGTGIARDAAGRGLSVLLCEQDDLASHTSSASTKLVHGGLRYLEHGDLRLVRESLRERERLLAIAPHIVWPLQFVLPHRRELRSAWMIQAGLFLYDHLGSRRRLPRSFRVDLRRSPLGEPLSPTLTRGFVYADCWAQDSRMVVLNAKDAAARGARIMTRTKFEAATGETGLWRIRLSSQEEGRLAVRARAVVNAAGPWAGSVFKQILRSSPRQGIRLVKGSHIVLRRLFAHDHAYILQHEDRRVVFAIPYEHDFTLVGTTEIDYPGDPAAPRISHEETLYLCDVISRNFVRGVTPEDVLWSYSGVRPLYGDSAGSPSAVTRDYALELNRAPGGALLLSVFGGKLTTFRRLAEQAVERLRPALGIAAGPWTANHALPGGDFQGRDFKAFLGELRQRYRWLPERLSWRLARNYGTAAQEILAAARGPEDLGLCLGPQLHEAELRYLVREEWAREADDVLWRRTKLGLRFSRKQAEDLEQWMREQGSVPA